MSDTYDHSQSRKVTCKLCGATLDLNQDTPETRAKHCDPHQQLRLHIAIQHADHAERIVRKAAFLLDAIVFDGEDSRWWKNHQIELLDNACENMK